MRVLPSGVGWLATVGTGGGRLSAAPSSTISVDSSLVASSVISPSSFGAIAVAVATMPAMPDGEMGCSNASLMVGVLVGVGVGTSKLNTSGVGVGLSVAGSVSVTSVVSVTIFVSVIASVDVITFVAVTSALFVTSCVSEMPCVMVMPCASVILWVTVMPSTGATCGPVRSDGKGTTLVIGAVADGVTGVVGGVIDGVAPGDRGDAAIIVAVGKGVHVGVGWRRVAVGVVVDVGAGVAVDV